MNCSSMQDEIHAVLIDSFHSLFFHYRYEQAFLITALIGWQSVFWIGLNDFHIDGTFYWTDSSPVKFTNWGAGQPSRSRTFPSCVSMTSFGRWINRQCWQRRGYICEAGGSHFTAVLQKPAKVAKPRIYKPCPIYNIFFLTSLLFNPR